MADLLVRWEGRMVDFEKWGGEILVIGGWFWNGMVGWYSFTGYDKLNNWVESLNAEKIKIRPSSKVKDDIGLIKTEEKDNQFLKGKTIGAVEKTTRTWLVWKKPWNYAWNWKNYSPCRRVYQSLHVDIADVFIQYVHSLEPDEIKQLDDDGGGGGRWGVESIVDIQTSFEILRIF